MAKLQCVLIHNFRNVADKEINILGSNIISGPNMTGKTNTLNAIHWAFTGVDLDGSKDNRDNFPIDGGTKFSVELQFDSFTFKRVCEMVDDSPTVTTYVDGEQTRTVKVGDALLIAKLGLSDLVLTQPKGFDIIQFLLNPLYFNSVTPGALRKFFYKLSYIDLDEIAEKQTKPVLEVLRKRNETDPYKLNDAVTKEAKSIDAQIKTCDSAVKLFPSIEKEAADKKKEFEKQLAKLEAEEALVDKYALSVSKKVNEYYQQAMGIKICIIEKGVGDGVYKDVCYPILPKSGLPFSAGSQAEKTYVGVKFINEVCKTWNINPLIVLIDNMESLDEFTTKYVNELGVQYIGALVR